METNIDLSQLDYRFKTKPILVGGKAMEYHGLRKAGTDIDLIAEEQDVVQLIHKYPDKVKDLWGDLGISVLGFEIWRTIRYLDYSQLKANAIDVGEVLVISEEKLLFMKALAMKHEKYLQDALLIAFDIEKKQAKSYEQVKNYNKNLLQSVARISYLEKLGN